MCKNQISVERIPGRMNDQIKLSKIWNSQTFIVVLWSELRGRIDSCLSNYAKHKKNISKLIRLLLVKLFALV